MTTIERTDCKTAITIEPGFVFGAITTCRMNEKLTAFTVVDASIGSVLVEVRDPKTGEMVRYGMLTAFDGSPEKTVCSCPDYKFRIERKGLAGKVACKHAICYAQLRKDESE